MNSLPVIGVSQKNTWFISHRIRTMLTNTAPEVLEGTVEADETFVGVKNKNRHTSKKVANSQGRAHIDKTAVVGMLQRNGKIKTCAATDTSAATLQSLMIENVAPEAVIITDAYASYKGLESSLTSTFLSNTPKAFTKP